MNDKKEPFNAVGDPFFKQVGEEHVEVAEEEGKGKRQTGSALRNMYVRVRPGPRGGAEETPRRGVMLLECRSCNAATTPQGNGGAAGLLKSK